MKPQTKHFTHIMTFNTHNNIHSLNRYLFSTYSVPGTLLGAWIRWTTGQARPSSSGKAWCVIISNVQMRKLRLRKGSIVGSSRGGIQTQPKLFHSQLSRCISFSLSQASGRWWIQVSESHHLSPRCSITKADLVELSNPWSPNLKM